jgi:molybdopterin synthase catalytic subunit
MRVRVLFFGVFRELAGKSADEVELRDNASAGDLLAYYEHSIPQLRPLLVSAAIAVNQEYAILDRRLQADDEVALLPPVSGGSGANVDDTLAGRPAGSPRYALIVRGQIDSRRTVSSLKRGDDGAIVIFEGTVRNQTRGREALYLEYEGYEPMALQQMESLAAQALQEFQIRDVALVHRLGRLEIGETSVLIVVAAAHRAAAFDACRWLIDTLKRVVPIWKKEYFADGAVWADGEPFPAEISRAKSPRSHP